MVIKTAVLGATGFTGEKLVEILLGHPEAEISYLSSRTEKAVLYSKLFPKFKKRKDLTCEPLDIAKAAEGADVLFLSLPHTVSAEFVPFLLKKKKKVIDLSADYRLKDVEVYKKYYGVTHKDKKNLKQAVYGLGELFKDEIKQAELIANPGCYATSVILPLFPLLKDNLVEKDIIVDAKSAITGAGRKAALDYHYSNVADNIWAYKPFVHQHVPEIAQVLRDSAGKTVELVFVPQVIGVEAGIYSTIYVSFKNKVDVSKIQNVYKKYYKDSPFIRICGDLPKLKNVVGTNFCDMGFAVDSSGKKGVIVSCIDNLIKGAAGAAVQNMNIMMGWEETRGLI